MRIAQCALSRYLSFAWLVSQQKFVEHLERPLGLIPRHQVTSASHRGEGDIVLEAFRISTNVATNPPVLEWLDHLEAELFGKPLKRG